MSEDVILYKEFLNGNLEAFDTLMEKYRKNLVYFIQRYVNSIEIAEDLAQDVFVYILINKKEYDFKYSMKTYLFTIARSRAINYLKREKKYISIIENMNYNESESYINNIEEKMDNEDRQEKIYKAIRKLNANHQQAIYLVDIEEMTYSEIGKILGKSLSQTKMLIYRARKNLKKILEKEDFYCE